MITKKLRRMKREPEPNPKDFTNRELGRRIVQTTQQADRQKENGENTKDTERWLKRLTEEFETRMKAGNWRL